MVTMVVRDFDDLVMWIKYQIVEAQTPIELITEKLFDSEFSKQDVNLAIEQAKISITENKIDGYKGSHLWLK